MSVVPGFEYDIFISYRHNDNLDGWVTDFVRDLDRELRSTLKDSLTIYFDKNPTDGLLETHNVDKSLERKLKSLVFIPILSQTYCDPKSFAWQHEFCAFNELTKHDRIGRDVKLANGNVASRILPIRIHDLDEDDRRTIEREIGSALRAIEFMYREPGVNRPLRPSEDNASKNQTQISYRNQVNKVANAVKDLVYAMLRSTEEKIQPALDNSTQTNIPKKYHKRIGISAIVIFLAGIISFSLYYFAGFGRTFEVPERSIAVLPFENMNKDSEQDYFANGIAEDILNHLVKVADLKVKSRTSTLQYKGTTKSVTTIGEELGVNNVVEGSVRRVGDKVRIVVQLIDAQTDVHLWSETYDRELKDVLALQSEIAIEIAHTLEARLTSKEKNNIAKEVTSDVTAYDYYLQARDRYNTILWNKEELNKIKQLLDKAIELDATFSKAYSLRGDVWFQLGTFGLPQTVWEDSAFQNTRKSLKLDPENSDAYLIQSRIERFLGNLSKANENLKMAYSLNPKDLAVQLAFGYELIRSGEERGADMVIHSVERTYSTKQTEYYESLVWPLYWAGDYEGAEKMLKEAIRLNPNSDNNYYWLYNVYVRTEQFENANKIALEELRMNPDWQGSIDNLAWSYFRLKKYEKAASTWVRYKEIEAKFEDKTQTVPFRHRLAMTYFKMGNERAARELLVEDSLIQHNMLLKTRSTGAWGAKSGVYYDLAVDNALLGLRDRAIQNLDSAVRFGFVVDFLYDKDPAFEQIKDSPGFRKVQDNLNKQFKFRKQAFVNALNRRKNGNELKGLLDK
jgi:TolB-like protein/Flp pilus assembly protein TadD